MGWESVSDRLHAYIEKQRLAETEIYIQKQRLAETEISILDPMTALIGNEVVDRAMLVNLVSWLS